jgi:hypothetical protein
VLGLMPNPWVILAVVLSIVGAFGGGYWRGYQSADKSADLEIQAKVIQSLEGALAEQRRQASAAQLIAEAANARQVEAERRADDIAEEIDDYVRRLEQVRPACDCGLSSSDVERLRHFAGSGRTSTPSNPPRSPVTRPRARAGDQGR